MKSSKITLSLLAICLILPVDLAWGSFETLSFPISLVLLPFAVHSFATERTPDSALLLFCFATSLISAAIASAIAPNPSIRPLGSILWFFLPITSFFLGKRIINSERKLKEFLLYSSNIALILSLGLLFTIGYGHEFIVRNEGTMNGSLFGVPLAGTYGVHTIAAHFYLIWGLVLYRYTAYSSTKWQKSTIIFTLALLTYLMIMSLSREIVLALMISLAVIGYRKYGLYYTLILLLATALTASYFSAYLIEESVWATKILQSLNSTDLNELSSGRIELQVLALSQLIEHPLIGTGFYGYALDFTQSESYSDLSGWSTHAYFLTSIWKMGIPAGIVFVLFILLAVRKSISRINAVDRSQTRPYAPVVITFLLIVNSLWDALLAPNVSMLFLFFLGATLSAAQSQKRKAPALSPNLRRQS